jgi:hypothetical protein
MSTAETDRIIARLTTNPRSTAQECGVTIVKMKALAEQGLIEEFGPRSTGKRGRPPVEWVIAGTKDDHGTPEQAQREDQERRAEEWLSYRRSWDHLWHMREAGLRNSDEYRKAHEAHYERWPMGTVPPVVTMKDDEKPADDEILVAA